jgi:hypothetical protein
MGQYRTRPAGEVLAPPRQELEPFGPDTITVYESGNDYRATGILNADGREIEVFVGLEPIGFLWDREGAIG